MIIKTNYGQLEGTLEDGCVVFRGVPYAKAPQGELRFRKPQEIEPWSGVYKADHFRNKSMQGPTRPGFYKKEFYDHPDFQTDSSEDGLYLNIWAPEEAFEGGAKLPVAVYVHGGAFMGGAGSNLPFVCHNLVKKGVIIVTINYRLGVFGFLCHPILAIEGENKAGGNYGLWDQLFALKWVKENITAFGGDEKNITAFGQSAGAMSLQVLALSEKTKGYVDKMILQSGGGYKNPLGAYKPIGVAVQTAEDVFEALGFEREYWKRSERAKEEILARLRSISAEELLAAADTAIGKSFARNEGLPFVPVVDRELLTDDGNLLVEAHKFLDIPYILGANGDDLTTEETKKRTPENNLMHIGNVAYAKYVNEQQGRAYVYYFDRKLPGDDAGAFHSGELWYVFGSLKYAWRPWKPADYNLSEEMMDCWTNFMKTGNPNSAGDDSWKPCTENEPAYKVFA